MKTKGVKRILIGICAFIMVLVCLFGLVSVAATPVSAARTPAPSATVRRTNYKTTDRKPTYTATLNENNKLLKQLEEKINGQNGEKTNKALSFAKIYGKDIIAGTLSIINIIKDASKGEADWHKFGIDFTKGLIMSIAEAYGFGGALQNVFNGIEAVLSKGEAPLSEIQGLAADLNNQFNDMRDQLYDIQDQIGAVSNDVKAAVTDILGGTSSQIEALDAKQILRTFMSRGEGNFSYNQFQNYIYGSTGDGNPNKLTAYYNQLMEAIVFGADDSVIQYYYNKLFDSVQSGLEIFREYYFGNMAGMDKSITKYYYDYLSANSSLIENGNTAESMAVEFAYDLYSTYVFSYEIIKLCYSYQISEMFIEESLKNGKLNDYSKYPYNATDFITYGTITADLEDIEAYMARAEEMIVSDLAYIFRLGESYTVLDSGKQIHDITKYGDTFGNVEAGQEIYLNKIPDSVNEMFELDADKYSYSINDVLKTNRNEFGVLKGKDITDTFRASVKYGDQNLYTINFSARPTSSFSGGSGDCEDPYLISNEYQFTNISKELNACYELIDDLDFETLDLTPIGTYDKPFNGILKGNGHKISNLNVNSLVYDEKNVTLIPTTGLFGSIGDYGIVENLTIENIKVVSDYDTDKIAPQADNSVFYVGAVAGYNSGTIYNCAVKNNSGITVKRDKQVAESRNVEVYVGGIAGINLNNISYCTVDATTIDAASHLHLHAQPIQTNQNTLLVGGITATTTKTISYCRVSDSVKLSAYAKSTAFTSEETSPYITVKTGGIVADESASLRLAGVYSGATITKCRCEIVNEGTYWGKHKFSYRNSTMKSGKYYPTYFWLSEGDDFDEVEQALYGTNKDGLKEGLVAEAQKAEAEAIKELGKDVITDYNDPSFVISADKFEVSIADKTVYEGSDKKLNEEALSFTVNGTKLEDVRIVAYYGFNSYNEEQNTVTNPVRIFFVANVDGEERVLFGDVGLTIAADRIVGVPVVSGIKTEYNITATQEEALGELFTKGFMISYNHANGKTENYPIRASNKADVEITDFNISDCAEGKFTFNIHHNGNTIPQTATVVCSHANLTEPEFVKATCQSLGYEIQTCEDCKKEFPKNYTIGDHHYIVEDGVPATCFEPGYTKKVKCDVCGTVFEESSWIQVKEHEYIKIEDAVKLGYDIDDSHSGSVYHYCVNGNHYEPHQYLVTENTNGAGKLVYTYTCRECGHWYDEIDENLITGAEGKMPTVYVTDGYVLKSGDEVVVYVQLLNNPGFNGASFGIRYSDGLELIGSEEGTIIPDALNVSNEVYKGYNYLWAKKSKENWVEDGYILKLVFKVTSEAREDQKVEVVYAYQKVTYENGKTEEAEGGFATTSEKYGVQKFLTHSGTISFVDHLPGDVYKNGEEDVVDVMDAMYIAWGIVGKPGVTYKKQYADVNLDGIVDLYDVIWILQSITGNYGTNLLNYKYDLQLNLNGFDTEAFDKLLTVYFYDEEGEINSWNTQIPFEEYEKEMNRQGYSFIGWYTRLVGGEKVDISKKIKYDPALGTQTLYAHWALNSITFDTEGATSEPIKPIEYRSDNSTVTLSDYVPELKYAVEYRVVGHEGIYDSGTIEKVFEGWYYLNGEKAPEILDLSVANLGNITLTAHWSTNYKWEKPVEKRFGYNNVTAWYWEQQYDENHLIGEVINDEIAEKLIKPGQNKVVIYGQPNYVQFTINYNKYGSGNYNSDCLEGVSVVNCDTKFSFAKDSLSIKNLGDVSAYKFVGWYINGKEISKIDIDEDNVKSIFGDSTEVTLTAKWRAKPIKVTIEGLNEAGITTIYYCNGDDSYSAGYYFDEEFKKSIETVDFSEKISNYTVAGCYLSPIEKNGHSYTQANEEDLFINENGAILGGAVQENLTLYALCKPKLVHIIFENYTGFDSGSDTKKVAEAEFYYGEAGDPDTDKNKIWHAEPLTSLAYQFVGFYYGDILCFDASGNPYSNDASGNPISDNCNSLQAGNVTLRAHWKRDVSYQFIAETSFIDITGNSVNMYSLPLKEGTNYKLLSNLDLSRENWTMMSNYTGTFDGCGHTVKGLREFFCATNSGSIINTVFSDFSINQEFKHNNLNMGMICCFNNGIVRNCKLQNSAINITDKSDDHVSLNINLGGLCGINYNTIESCEIKNTSITFTMPMTTPQKYWYTSGQTYYYNCCSGAIAAINANGGKISDCTVLQCSVSGTADQLGQNAYWAFDGGQNDLTISGSYYIGKCIGKNEGTSERNRSSADSTRTMTVNQKVCYNDGILGAGHKWAEVYDPNHGFNKYSVHYSD